MTDTQKYKLLPAGGDTYSEIITKNKYYVDKTLYLRSVFAEDGSSVLLFTRPRRFGKTLLMDMFADFFRLNYLNPSDTTFQQKRFADKKIMKDKAFVDKYMGQFPVIFISLKDIKGINYDIAKGGLINLVKELARTFSFLQKSEVLSEDDKLDLKNLCSDAYLKDPFNQNNLTSALSFLSSCLYKHFKRQVILLIDEYDVPLAKAAAGKYHKEMVELISSFLGVLKNTPKNTNEDTAPILKVVMTGCLKVAKNSIFTGVNNVVVNTVLNTQTKFTSTIGFNKEETKKVLEDYNLSDYEGMVKENYDGYRFYNEEMFCPWDVINFVAENYEHKLNGTESDIKPGNYWNATSSSKILQEYLGYLNKRIRESLQNLVDGKSIEVKINDSMNYDDLKLHDPDDFFSLLLHTGYLTAVDNPSKNNYLVKIPNKEILECFNSNITEYFNDMVKEGPDFKAVNIAKSLLKGDEKKVEDLLSEVILTYVSTRAFATKSNPENFYQGFLSGIFVNCKDVISDYRSNAEAGLGYLDFAFKDDPGKTAVVIEIKFCRSTDELLNAQKVALEQIKEKKYAESYIKDSSIDHVYAYAIAFSNKYCRVKVEALK